MQWLSLSKKSQEGR